MEKFFTCSKLCSTDALNDESRWQVARSGARIGVMNMCMQAGAANKESPRILSPGRNLSQTVWVMIRASEVPPGKASEIHKNRSVTTETSIMYLRVGPPVLWQKIDKISSDLIRNDILIIAPSIPLLLCFPQHLHLLIVFYGLQLGGGRFFIPYSHTEFEKKERRFISRHVLGYPVSDRFPIISINNVYQIAFQQSLPLALIFYGHLFHQVMPG